MTPIQLMTATNAYNDLVKATEVNTRAAFLKAVESMTFVVDSEPMLDKVSSLIEADSDYPIYPALANNLADAVIYARNSDMLEQLRELVEAEQVDALSGDNVIPMPVEEVDHTQPPVVNVLLSEETAEQVAELKQFVEGIDTSVVNQQVEAVRQIAALSDELQTNVSSAVNTILELQTKLLNDKLSDVRALGDVFEGVRNEVHGIATECHSIAAAHSDKPHFSMDGAAIELLRAIFANGNPMHLAATVRRMARKDKEIGKLALAIIRDVDKEEAYAKHLQSKARSTSINLDDL